MAQYMLYDTATERLEAYQLMEADEAEERNNDLRADNDPRRWIPVLDDEEPEIDLLFIDGEHDYGSDEMTDAGYVYFQS